MAIDIRCIPVGLLQANCYVLTAQEGEVAIIDPGDDADKILKRVPDSKKVCYIFATHLHIDHIGALPAIAEACSGAKVYLPEKDLKYKEKLNKGLLNELVFPRLDMKSLPLNRNSRLPFGGDEFEVIETPGHTPGSVSLKLGNSLFTGDTLFYGSLGTTELPGGNKKEQEKSKKILSKLPDDMIVYPGHLYPTSIGVEKQGGIL